MPELRLAPGCTCAGRCCTVASRQVETCCWVRAATFTSASACCTSAVLDCNVALAVSMLVCVVARGSTARWRRYSDAACAWLARADSRRASARLSSAGRAHLGDLQFQPRRFELRAGKFQIGPGLVAGGEVVARVDAQDQVARVRNWLSLTTSSVT